MVAYYLYREITVGFFVTAAGSPTSESCGGFVFSEWQGLPAKVESALGCVLRAHCPLSDWVRLLGLIVPLPSEAAKLQPKPALQPLLINSANICRPSQCQARDGHCGCCDESHGDAAPPLLPSHLTAHRGSRHRNTAIDTVTPTTATRCLR